MTTDKIFDISIITPSNIFLACKVISANIPGNSGPFQVLVNHAPIVASITSGILKVVDESNNINNYYIENGFAELRNNNLAITVSTAEKISDIDISKLEQIIKDAKLSLEQSDIPKNKFELLTNKIKLTQNKIDTVSKMINDRN
jgi:F-type H+-transporting ATPase subunit epsilon